MVSTTSSIEWPETGTTIDLLKAKMTTSNPHAYVSTSSGERYTPEYIVEAARFVLGRIELDPASCARANEIVKADGFLSRENDSLGDDVWHGHVFLNPPGSCRNEHGVLEVCGNPKVCSCKLVPQFWEKLLTSLDNIPAAIWIGFHLDQLQALQTPLCFPTCVPAKRIQYLDSNFNKMPQPPHGSYITLVTMDPESEYVERFIHRFGVLGQVVGALI